MDWKRMLARYGIPVMFVLTGGYFGAAPVGGKYHVATWGNDAWPGGALAPLATIRAANAKADVRQVWVKPGTYADAPDRSGVVYVGAVDAPGDTLSREERIITGPVSLRGPLTKIQGFTLAGGLFFKGGADRDSVIDCRVRGDLGFYASATKACRLPALVRCDLDLRSIDARDGSGVDRSMTAPRVVEPTFESCQVTVTRKVGEPDRVLWRMSSVDRPRLLRSSFTLTHQTGGSNGDDAASIKFLSVRGIDAQDCIFTSDYLGDFMGTGPFFPMLRDSTYGAWRRCTFESVRGNMYFSPNTAGTWVCSCSGSTFDEIVLKAPGTIFFYQCPIRGDRWSRSHAFAGRFNKYNSGGIPTGLVVGPYVGP